jgi:hypothetical protein
VTYAQSRPALRDDGTPAPPPLVLPPTPAGTKSAAEVCPTPVPFPIAGEAIADDGSHILVYQHASGGAPEAPGQVTTTFASNNGAAGNMFDMTPKTDLQITGLDVNLSNAGDNCVIALWGRLGTYVGHETSSAGWFLFGLASATAAGTDQPTHFDFTANSETFNAFTTYGIYVDFTNINNTSSILRYTNGSQTLQTTDMNITFGAGIGGPSFTGSVFTPRIWNGTIYYNTCASAQGQLNLHSFGTGFIARGAMFDLIPKRDLTLTAVIVEQGVLHAPTHVDVWYRQGTHAGFDNSPAGWIHLESGEVTGSGPGQATYIDVKANHLKMLAGQTYGIYVDLNSFNPANNYIMVSPGTQTIDNADLTYISGLSKATSPPFTGTTLTGESMHGAIRYVTSGESGMNAGSFVGGNGFAGNMFDIQPGYDLFIRGMDLNIDSAQSTVTVDVYWTDNTYVGKENSSAGWTLLERATVCPRGLNIPTFIDLGTSTKLFRASQSYGIYVALSSYSQGSQTLAYTDGQIFAGDWGLSMNGGVGKGDPPFTGSTFNGRIWNGTIFYDATAATPNLYCHAKMNSLGCYPLMDWYGRPKAVGPTQWVIFCRSVRNQKPGLLFYSVNGAGSNTPFQGGTLCIGPSGSGIKRSISVNSGGSALPASDCSGRFQIDMDAFAHGLLGGTPQPGLTVPGNRIWTQWWGRDPGFPAPNNSTLSDAMYYTVTP